MRFLNWLLGSILGYVPADRQDVTQKNRHAFFMRIAGYHSLSVPEVSDNFPDAGPLPIHEQVSSENPDG